MRELMQIARFYIINKGISARSMENLLNNPNYNPLLKKCVETVKRYPDWAIKTCYEYRKAIDNRTFKFNSGTWAMDVREEDLPKGTTIDFHDLKQAFLELITWITENKEKFAKELKENELKHNS